MVTSASPWLIFEEAKHICMIINKFQQIESLSLSISERIADYRGSHEEERREERESDRNERWETGIRGKRRYRWRRRREEKLQMMYTTLAWKKGSRLSERGRQRERFAAGCSRCWPAEQY